MESSPDPKGHFIGALLEMLPPQILAAGIIKGCGKLAAERPELAQRILQNSWLDISRLLQSAIKEMPHGRAAASALVIESYFMNKGDWGVMEREMASHSPIDSALTARVIELISQGLDHAKAVVK